MTSGLDVLKKAALHIGEPYNLGVVVPKDNPAWRGPWDCAEFASWCVFQSSDRLYGCDNNTGNPVRADAFSGYWRRDAAAIGRTISVALAAQTPGAAVLRFPQPNLIGHVVFSNGAGGTIEAHSSAKGVIRSTLAGRRWDIGVLVPWIDYQHASDPVVVTSPLLVIRLTTPLTRGAIVKEIQRRLKGEGFHPGRIDGIYGMQTVAAVSGFQIARGLVPDGEVGTETAAALGVSFPG
ncbi:MAG TPA: peptidoglycan-binding domain-containing protein [Vicinamibacterales bacterium]